MTVRKLFSLAAAVTIGLASISSTYAQSRKAPAVNVNQQLANNVAAHLGQSPVSDGCSVNVTASNGVVQLTGEVRSQQQAQMMFELAQSYPGVKKVETSLRLLPNANLRPVQAAEPIPAPQGNPPAAPPGYGLAPTDPIPLMQPAMPAYDMNGPRMPPFAWPTYAPYPNMSRVAYPQSYPYNAFPFIGPFYPFPKVPLGWRSVKMEWEDGHWYLGRLSTPHDYWRIKFW